MPFRSQAQRKYLFANHPQMAHEWAHETPDIKALPEHVGDKQKSKEASLRTRFAVYLLKKANDMEAPAATSTVPTVGPQSGIFSGGSLGGALNKFAADYITPLEIAAGGLTAAGGVNALRSPPGHRAEGFGRGAGYGAGAGAGGALGTTAGFASGAGVGAGLGNLAGGGKSRIAQWISLLSTLGGTAAGGLGGGYLGTALMSKLMGKPSWELPKKAAQLKLAALSRRLSVRNGLRKLAQAVYDGHSFCASLQQLSPTATNKERAKLAHYLLTEFYKSAGLNMTSPEAQQMGLQQGVGMGLGAAVGMSPSAQKFVQDAPYQLGAGSKLLSNPSMGRVAGNPNMLRKLLLRLAASRKPWAGAAAAAGGTLAGGLLGTLFGGAGVGANRAIQDVRSSFSKAK